MTRIPIPGDAGLAFFGIRDRNLRGLGELLGLTLASRGDVLLAEGPDDRIALLSSALDELAAIGGEVARYRMSDLRTAVRILGQHPGASLREYFLDTVVQPAPGKTIRPRSFGQLQYLRAMRQSELVLCAGPSGNRKDVACDGGRGRGASDPAGPPDRLHPPRGRGRRETGLPARRPHREGGSLPASALRRAPRHDGPRAGDAPARARSHRDRPDRLHAGGAR